MQPSAPIMRYLILAACLATCLCGCSGKESVVQVCCYSTSPDDYRPNCYKCPTTVYTNTLMACVNVTEMPRNITFKQATCVEKNCEINYPQPEQESTNSLARYADLAQLISQVLSGGGFMPVAAGSRAKRDVDVVKRVETLITGLGAVEFGEPEYV